jgi:Predicted metal-dependent hydrolase of the TIM-barrel fold
MTDRIDAHHHLWHYDKQEHDWITAGMETIARDFTVTDLQAELAPREITGSIVVQACQTLRETEWLLDLAADSPLIRGVVGWAPIADRSLPKVLEALKAHKKLKGLRHVIQAEPDDEFILRSDFNAGIGALAGSGLVYDILIYERHLPAAMKFVDRHPEQIFVLDHLAKPRIKEQLLEPWRTSLFELAKRENVYCKLSGMVTEANWGNWSAADLRPYADAALEAFGPSRLMFGSDWPVCLLACSYQSWMETVTGFLRELSRAEQNLVFGGVARKVYSLSAPEAAERARRA